MMEDIPITENEESDAEPWRPISDGDVYSPRTSITSSHLHMAGRDESSEIERLTQLEEEQEHLNAALLALTSHFAQVQFRLQQLSKADPAEREHMLSELEEFAFQGCPNITAAVNERKRRSSSTQLIGFNDEISEPMSEADHNAVVAQQQIKQLQLIGQLRDQLEELERYAYEAGEGGLPTNALMEKQRLIIDRLRDRIELDVDELDRLGPDELQKAVDAAVKRLITPTKEKDQVIAQLKTQIVDLERFVEFLQLESANNQPCTCDKNKSSCAQHSEAAKKQRIEQCKAFGFNKKRDEPPSSIASAVHLLQMRIQSQLGCASKRTSTNLKFHRNELKRTSKGNHWGDLRAALEIAVDNLFTICKRHKLDELTAQLMDKNIAQSSTTLHVYSSDDEGSEDVFENCPEEVVNAVRRYFCKALRDLIQHGLLTDVKKSSSSASLIGCFSSRQRPPPSISSINAESVQKASTQHAWSILYAYFTMKNGREFSDAPARRLTASFGLDSVGGQSVTSRQQLLETINEIYLSHSKLKRSDDTMFKAFVCAALNRHRLVPWLRMILRTKEIVDEHYETWSYVARTGFEDALALIDRLNAFTFHLPADLAVRHFRTMKDAF